MLKSKKGSVLSSSLEEALSKYFAPLSSYSMQGWQEAKEVEELLEPLWHYRAQQHKDIDIIGEFKRCDKRGSKTEGKSDKSS